jgi:hypothetical protein
MTLPTTRITITLLEFQLLSPGLDILANGLAAAKLGAYPHRHPWDRIDTSVSGIHRDRAYDEEMAQRIVTTRAELIGMTATRKVRFDVFQMSVAALALRLGKLKARSSLPCRNLETSNEHKMLILKLEKYRKRARRAGLAKLGSTEFAKAAESWREFNQWMRYNLLQFTFRNRPSSLHALKTRELRKAVGEMIQHALREHFHAELPEAVLSKMVTLSKSSFLRGRQPMTLKELLASEGRGRDLLFAFVTARIETSPLPGAVIPQWKLAMDRAERFLAFKTTGRRSSGLHSA